MVVMSLPFGQSDSTWSRPAVSTSLSCSGCLSDMWPTNKRPVMAFFGMVTARSAYMNSWSCNDETMPSSLMSHIHNTPNSLYMAGFAADRKCRYGNQPMKAELSILCRACHIICISTCRAGPNSNPQCKLYGTYPMLIYMFNTWKCHTHSGANLCLGHLYDSLRRGITGQMQGHLCWKMYILQVEMSKRWLSIAKGSRKNLSFNFTNSTNTENPKQNIKSR